MTYVHKKSGETTSIHRIYLICFISNEEYFVPKLNSKTEVWLTRLKYV